MAGRETRGEMRRYFGLDLIDLAIHVGVTGAIGAFLVATGLREEIVWSAVTTISLVVLAARRRYGMRSTRAETTGESLAHARVADLEQRLSELEQRDYRVAELEERLDFAERLLAQGREERPKLGARET
jgi:hypothetical protein